jgi:hypothetical protein
VFEQMLFVFSSAPAARLFVKSLVNDLDFVAALIMDEAVSVIDGGTEEGKPQGARIRQLARSSGSMSRV